MKLPTKLAILAAVPWAFCMVMAALAQTPVDSARKNLTAASVPAQRQAASLPASQPASQPASAPASKPDVHAARVVRGGGYFGVLLRSKEIAKMAVSKSNLDGIGKAFTIYASSNERFPKSLDELVNDGYLSEPMLHSPIDPNCKYVYLPGASPESAPSRIIVYEPVSYNGRVLVLQADMSVATIESEEELDRRVEAQK